MSAMKLQTPLKISGTGYLVDSGSHILAHCGDGDNAEMQDVVSKCNSYCDLLEALEASLICLEWWRTRYPIDASGKEARVIANAQAALKKAKP